MGIFEVGAQSSAQPSTVYNAISDVERYPQWQDVDTVELMHRPSALSEAGAVWILHHERTSTRLVVVEAVPPCRWEYRLENSDIWVEYRAEVTAARDDAGGTNILWRGDYRPLLAGRGHFWSTYMEFMMQQRVNDLAAVSSAQVR